MKKGDKQADETVYICVCVPFELVAVCIRLVDKAASCISTGKFWHQEVRACVCPCNTSPA